MAKSEENYIFACQAAVPLVLTLDLLYQLWNNFKQYQYVFEPQQFYRIPHTAVSDLLLSPLCRKVGFELYEMNKELRDYLLQELVSNLGEKRRNTIAAFLQDYAQLEYRYAHRKNLKHIHVLTAQSFLDPAAMEREIIERINNAETDSEKINYLVLHQNLVPIGYESDLSNISKEVIDPKHFDTLSPILIEETDANAPGVLNIGINLPDMLKCKIKRVLPEQVLALQLIEACIKSNKASLDLSSYGLRDDHFVEGSPIERSLRKCTHLSTLILRGLPELREFPKVILHLNKLQVLRVRGRQAASSSIQFLPEELAALKELQELNLSYNALTELPASMGRFLQMEKLLVNGNQLRSIPPGIGSLRNLQELDISDNFINELPASLLQLTKLKKIGLKNNPVVSHLSEEDLARPAKEILRLLIPQKENLFNSPISENMFTAIEGVEAITSIPGNRNLNIESLRDKPVHPGVEVYISCSPGDAALLEELENHLLPLKSRGLISVWLSHRIMPGNFLEPDMEEHLHTANVILLLISPSFIASDFALKEMQLAMERHSNGIASVIPIILRSCDWRSLPIASLQALPANGKAIMDWSDKHEAFLSVVQDIGKAIDVDGLKLKVIEEAFYRYKPSLHKQDYVLGGTTVELSVAEPYSEIPNNRTLIAVKLTKDLPVNPEVVYGLRSVEEVFGHYKPEITLNFIDENGSFVKETLRFKTLEDFRISSIVPQSKFLDDLMMKREQFQKIIRQLKVNRAFKAAISNENIKESIIMALKAMAIELQGSNPENIVGNMPLDENFGWQEQHFEANLSSPEESLNSSIESLQEYGGFELLESAIDGVKNLDPIRKARKKIFLSEDTLKGRRQELKNILMCWINVLDNSAGADELIQACQKNLNQQELMISDNVNIVLEHIRELEQAYHTVDLFYKNAGAKVKNVSFINAGLEQLNDLNNTRFIDAIHEELSRNYNRLDFRDNYSILVIPGYLGSNEAVEKWAKIVYQNKVLLITDFKDLDSADDVLESFEAANLTGGDSYRSNVIMTCNWLVGRNKFGEGGEAEDLYVPPSTALAGKIYNAQLSNVIAGRKDGGINEGEGVRFALEKSEIANLERSGLIPMVHEWGKVMAFSAKTLFNGNNLGMQTYPVVRAFDYVSKVLMDILNRQSFEFFHSGKEKEIRKQIVVFLDKISGPYRLIEEFSILRFEQDPGQKGSVFLDIRVRPFFPAKKFTIKLRRDLNDDFDGPGWTSEYIQEGTEIA